MEEQGVWVLVPGSLASIMTNFREMESFFAEYDIDFTKIDSRIQPEGFAIFVENPTVATLFKLTF